MNLKKNTFGWFLVPSLLGMLVFYCIPFAFSLYYAVTDNSAKRQFVGLLNFQTTFSQPVFQRAALNTAVFMAISVPLGMALGLIVAVFLQKITHFRPLAAILILMPLVVPSGSIAYFWRVLFGANGLASEVLLMCGVPLETVTQMQTSMAAVVVMFLWKNVSYTVLLFWSGLNLIPKTYYEQMAIEGAGGWQQFWRVTWVYLMPTTFVVLLLSIVNSFKVFKEIYMLYGAYPGESVYMLQHYMNNQFYALNMQKLSSAAYILFVSVSFLLLLVFRVQKKLTDAYN